MVSQARGYPMSDGKRTLGVLFRAPRFPLIVFGPARVGAARSLAGLAKVLATFPPSRPGADVEIVDPTGEEFWFDAEHSVLSPGFTISRWTKKQIIDAYNNSPEGHRLPCRATSLSGRKLADVVTEVCGLISHAGRRR